MRKSSCWEFFDLNKNETYTTKRNQINETFQLTRVLFLSVSLSLALFFFSSSLAFFIAIANTTQRFCDAIAFASFASYACELEQEREKERCGSNICTIRQQPNCVLLNLLLTILSVSCRRLLIDRAMCTIHQ